WEGVYEQEVDYERTVPPVPIPMLEEFCLAKNAPLTARRNKLLGASESIYNPLHDPNTGSNRCVVSRAVRGLGPVEHYEVACYQSALNRTRHVHLLQRVTVAPAVCKVVRILGPKYGVREEF